MITDKESVISRSEKIIFPGVGQAKSAVKNLHLLNLKSLLGMIKIPLLGICLGMQLLAEKSAEGDVTCLGILSGSSEKYNTAKVTVPHMGWSRVHIKKANRLFEGIPDLEYFYFAHSYYLPLNDFTVAVGDHGGHFSAGVQRIIIMVFNFILKNLVDGG